MISACVYLIFAKKGGHMDTNFTTSERELLIMLLQKEERTLHIEINHSSHREFRQSLKERLKMVTAMIEKLKIAEATTVF